MIEAIGVKTWCDGSNLCLLSQGDVKGVTQWLTSLKILLDKKFDWANGRGKAKAAYELLFLFISRLLAFDSDLCVCVCVHQAWYCSAKCKMWNLWIFNGTVTVSGQFVADTLRSHYQRDTEEIKSVSELTVLHKIWMLIQVCQPRRKCQCPLSFNILPLSSTTLWHVQSVRHMCVCTMLGFSVWFCVWSIWLSVSSHSLALFTPSLRADGCKTSLLFSRLKRPPYDQRDTSATNTTPRPNTMAAGASRPTHT